MIKTFRGILDSNLGNDAQNKIRLSTKKGKVGYRIFNLQIMPNQPGAVDTEGVVKIYKLKQSSVDGLVDFSDHNLLGAAYYTQYAGQPYDTNSMITIFDKETFNQDIFICYDEISGTQQKMNYYLELETIDLTDNAAAVSTLRDIRLNPQVGA